jgi:hypothetical protein
VAICVLAAYSGEQHKISEIVCHIITILCNVLLSVGCLHYANVMKMNILYVLKEGYNLEL